MSPPKIVREELQGVAETAATERPIARTDAGHEQRGLRHARWRMLFALMFVYLFYYTGRQNFGWALSSMEAELGLSMTQLGWISSAMLVSYGVGQFINGNLGDKFGARRMMPLGALLSAALNWLTSFGTSFWSILTPWAANGYVQSMGWAPGSRMLSNWWPHGERGKAFGWYVFAAGCSSILIFGLGAAIAAMHLSWQWVFRLPVLLLAAAGVIFYIVARNRPEDLGYPPVEDGPEHGLPENIPSPARGGDGQDESLQENVPFPSRAREGQGEGVSQLRPPHGQREETSIRRYAEVLKNGRFLLASLSIGFESLARYGLIIWLPVHLMGPAYEDQPAGIWIGIALPIGMALGALSSGYISDRFFGSNRSRPIAILMMLAMLVLLLIYALPPERIVLGIILLFLAGFLVYGPQSCYWALCPDVLGRHRAATAIGVMNMWAYIVAAAADPLIGWVIDHNGTRPLFLLLAGSCALGALVVMPIRR